MAFLLRPHYKILIDTQKDETLMKKFDLKKRRKKLDS